MELFYHYYAKCFIYYEFLMWDSFSFAVESHYEMNSHNWIIVGHIRKKNIKQGEEERETISVFGKKDKT